MARLCRTRYYIAQVDEIKKFRHRLVKKIQTKKFKKLTKEVRKK